MPEFPGCFLLKAENIPVKPAQDNACEGRSFIFQEAILDKLLIRIFSQILFFMKYNSLVVAGLLSVSISFAQQKNNFNDTSLLQPIEINAVRAEAYMPVVKTNLNKNKIEQNNIGRDIPFLLNLTPSVQVNSDAGNGIGYTGIRIRGTDASRINITLNGIPYNDAESQGTFLVNLPDFASSANAIQIQRGVGTSTNGAGAFGGSININTNEIDTKKYISFNNSAGSYHSLKNTLIANSGLLKKHFIFSGRLSNISSNGYVDRAKSKLQSFYTSAVYVDNHQSLRLNIFSGKEKTNAAWFGINKATLDSNRTFNPAGTEKPGTPYSNETDNYTQTHYQLFYNRKINEFLKFNISGFITTGKGYFEQYKSSQDLSNYGLPNYINGNDTITASDLVRQLWLDNKFYGTIFSLQYNKSKTNLNIGGSYNHYDGLHFGEIINASIVNAIPKNHKWYNNNAFKKDFSLYAKWSEKINSHWQTYLDLQIRKVNYRINGFESNPEILVRNNYLFFNPKAGITYTKANNKIYFSYAKAAKEPNRDDFETSIKEAPKTEKLHDFEIGFEQKNKKINWGINLYYMLYKDQLVLTGKVNDVYAYTRTNIPNSFRKGIEIQGETKLNKWLSINGNLTLSINKVKDYSEYIDNYDNGAQEIKSYPSANISYSPAIIAACEVIAKATKHLSVTLGNKYVGSQFMDNTSNKERKLKDYFTEDLRINYEKELKNKLLMNFFIQGNNILSKKYEPNGYTYSYYSGGLFTTENYYYPMATINVMVGINITL